MIINIKNTKDFIYTLSISLIYSTLIFYNNIGDVSEYLLILYSLLFIGGSLYIASNIESKNEDYFLPRLIKNILFGLVLAWVIYPSIITEIAGILLGFRIASKKKSDENNFSFQKYAWLQFKKNKIALFSLYLLFLLILIARFSPFIANSQPLYAVYKGVTMYPAFEDKNTTVEIVDPNTGELEKIQYDITDWRKMNLDKVIFAPIPYSPDFLDKENNDYVSPTGNQVFTNYNGKTINAPKKFRHHLGTDGKGVDLFSGLIHGTRIAMKVGLISMGIASFLGILLGSLAGYFGDRDLKMRRIKYYMTILGLFFGLFYGFGWRMYAIQEGFSQSNLQGVVEFLISALFIIGIIFTFRFISKFISIKWFTQEVTVPVDSIISRGIELLNSIPRLILIITVTAVMERSLTIIMVIIGVTGWTRIARFTRAELLRVKSLEFIQASKSLGFSSTRTIFKHALPNALAPVFVSIAFGIASAILIESGLSFLGIGVPDDVVTWGSLLNLGRGNIEAWWLILFPGIAIFLTITIYNMIAEASRDALDPRLKS
tara:strand:+ start:3551 stop:5182 length:1632 start_codon:yes stop_codon:yes gene_type:complete